MRAFGLKAGIMSRTQTLITQISHLCQEIRDIKRENKNRSNSTSKAEPRKGETLTIIQEERTMDSNQCQDRTNIDGTDGSDCTCVEQAQVYSIYYTVL